MRIVYQGDIHLRDTTPVNRIDDYQTAQFNKLRQLVDFANSNNACLFIGGDIFDTFRVSAETVNKTIQILSLCDYPVVATLGQHDVPYHRVDLVKSPAYQLWASNAIWVLEASGIEEIEDSFVHFHGWEQTIRNPLVEGRTNILLGHISVFQDKVPFYWKGEGYTAKTLKDEYPGYDLYLCGDIHVPFVKDNVVVSGSMMRMSIDLEDYRPRCYLIDTDDMDIQPLYYEIESQVFNIPESTVKENLELDNLIEAMKKSADLRNSYKRDCMTLATDRTKPIIQEIFNELD